MCSFEGVCFSLSIEIAGLGITLLPEMVVEQAIRQGDVHVISIEPPLMRKIYCISHMEEGLLLRAFEEER
ncbi:hypothetical protein COE30_24910 [Bacillus cereus]|nr:hypothetical protein COE30_24910 [Bacillus cereus]